MYLISKELWHSHPSNFELPKKNNILQPPCFIFVLVITILRFNEKYKKHLLKIPIPTLQDMWYCYSFNFEIFTYEKLPF